MDALALITLLLALSAALLLGGTGLLLLAAVRAVGGHPTPRPRTLATWGAWLLLLSLLPLCLQMNVMCCGPR